VKIQRKLGKVDVKGSYQQPQDLGRSHTLTAKEFSSIFGIDLNTAYGVLKRASNRLARTAITLEKPELFITQEIPICSFAEYNNQEGSLTIEFNEHIMPYLAQVKQKFVLYNLKEVANFGSLYTTRLYELIQEFKDTGYVIKSVVQLRDVFAVDKKFPDYNNFKRKTFAHAVDEINSQYEMRLRFEELKEGRKVVAIRFEFTPSYTAQGYNPTTKQMSNITVKPKRKPKQSDDNLPLPVPHNQLELPILSSIKEPKSTLQKVAKKMVNSKYAEKNFAPSIKKFYEKIDEEGLTRENLKTYAKERTDEIKQTAESVKAIIAAFMKKGLSETEAKIKAIELDLI